jgi:hypothetical protein
MRLPSISIEGTEVSKAILGCDPFISWMFQGGKSPFKGVQGRVNASRVLNVLKAAADCGVTGIDLSPPLIGAFQKLRDISQEEVVGLGALQEWTCKNFSIEGVPLGDYSKEIKATVRTKLPERFLKGLAKSRSAEKKFIRSFFVPKRSARPLTQHEIDSIRIHPVFFEERLKLYKQLDLQLVQFGGGTADWLVAIGRTDLLKRLSELIRKAGFTPILICHWTSITLPVIERELEVAGYIIPLNKMWGLLTLSETLEVIKNVEKPVIAMKVLAQGTLGNDLHAAFRFAFKKAKVKAVLVGVSSEYEAKQTFSAIAKTLAG